MQRITITIDDDLLETVDEVVRRRGYDSRSEALRDIVRSHVRHEEPTGDESPCIAALSFVFDHAKRDLARRMAHVQHDHHDLTVSSLHVHLNHESCMEVSVLRGPSASIRRLADALTSQRGVRHAHLHLVPVAVLTDDHEHGAGVHAHIHA